MSARRRTHSTTGMTCPPTTTNFSSSAVARAAAQVWDGTAAAPGRRVAVSYVVRLADGREVWRVRLPARAFTAPLVAGARVFVLTADRTVTAFDARTNGSMFKLPAGPIAVAFGAQWREERFRDCPLCGLTSSTPEQLR